LLLTEEEIADQLGVGKPYIEKYFDNILAKLGLNSRAQVAAWVINGQVLNIQKMATQERKGI